MKPLETLFLASTIAGVTACNSGKTNPETPGEIQEDSLTTAIFETMNGNVDKTKEFVLNYQDFDNKEYWLKVFDTLASDIGTVRSKVNSSDNTRKLSDSQKEKRFKFIQYNDEDWEEIQKVENRDSMLSEVRWDLNSDLSGYGCTATGYQPSDVYERGDNNWMGDMFGDDVARHNALIDNGKFPFNTKETEAILIDDVSHFPKEQEKNYYVLANNISYEGIAVTKEPLSDNNETANFFRFLRIANVGDTLSIDQNIRTKFCWKLGRRAERKIESKMSVQVTDPTTEGLDGLYKTYDGADFSYTWEGDTITFKKIGAEDAAGLRWDLGVYGFDVWGM